jgi:enoyl-CoA hydratase
MSEALIVEAARTALGRRELTDVHPVGGRFNPLNRATGRESAAAISLFDSEIDGKRAAEIGLAWQAMPDGDVETVAMQLARKAAKDPDLSRAAARSVRLELGPPMLSWEAALELEHAVQWWAPRLKATAD